MIKRERERVLLSSGTSQSHLRTPVDRRLTRRRRSARRRRREAI
jgi:hypothetical protein